MAATLFVFDGDCAFCTTWVRRGEKFLRRFPETQPWQWLDLDSLGLSRHDVTHYAWYLADGVRVRGHEAVAAVLKLQPGVGWRFLGHLLVTAPFSWAARLGYHLIAKYRHRLPGGTPACALEHEAEAISGLGRDASAEARPGPRVTDQ